eukprot:1063819_1
MASSKAQKIDFPHVGSVKLALDFEISDYGQDEIKKCGYYFNKQGQCLSLDTHQRPNKFETSAKFETFGALIEKYVFYLLQHQYKLSPIRLQSLDKPRKNSKSTKQSSAKPNSKKKSKKKKKKSKKWPTPEPTGWPTPADDPTAWPTPEPTAWPTPEPTDLPTSPPITPSTWWSNSGSTVSSAMACTDKYGNDEAFDHVIFIDNSCNLDHDTCDTVLNGVSDIISQLLHYPSSRVATLDYGQDKNDVHVVIDFDDDLQKSPSKYIEYVKKNGDCTDNGHDETDLLSVLQKGMDMLEDDDGKNRKFIIVSACMDDNVQICKTWPGVLMHEKIEVHVVNLVGASNNANNVLSSLQDAGDYLSCLSDNVCINDDLSAFNGVLSCLIPGICTPHADYATINEDEDDDGYPTPEPTPRPTSSPIKPTPEPTKKMKKRKKKKQKRRRALSTQSNDRMNVCDAAKRSGEQLDFVIFLDNSCKLKDDDCDHMRHGTGEIIYRLLDHPDVRIATVLFGNTREDVDVLVQYDDIELQQDASKYVDYITKHGECTEGGSGDTDLYYAIKRAQQLLDYSRISKFIFISACRDMDNVCKVSKDLDRCNIDTYIVNLIAGSEDVSNVIGTEDHAKEYLACLKPKKVCVGQEGDGISMSEFDGILDQCLLPDICEAHVKDKTH